MASDLEKNTENGEEHNLENDQTLSTEFEKKRSESPLRHSERLSKRKTPMETNRKLTKNAEAVAIRRAKRARGQSSSDNDSDANTKGISKYSHKISSMSLPSVNIPQQKVIQDDDEDDQFNIQREKHCSCGAAYDPKK